MKHLSRIVLVSGLALSVGGLALSVGAGVGCAAFLGSPLGQEAISLTEQVILKVIAGEKPQQIANELKTDLPTVISIILASKDPRVAASPAAKACREFMSASVAIGVLDAGSVPAGYLAGDAGAR